MRARNKLLLALGSILLVSALTTFFAPFLIAHGIARWLGFEARRSGLTIDFSEIKAPFLRPVEISNLYITGAGRGGVHMEIIAPRVEATLSLAAIFHLPVKTHPIRHLAMEHVHAFLRSRATETARALDYKALAALLPTSFQISADEIRFEQSLVSMDFRDTVIAARPGKNGLLSIGSLAIRAPQLQKNYTDLHGAARWQDNRLSIGSLRLVEGLVIDSFALDFNLLADGRVSAETGVTAFGGRLRANLAATRGDQARIWDAAGTASEISLAQLANALGLREDVRGLLRGSKFTFRGDPRDFLRATASVWLELTDFTWRDRKASSIMLGANFYNRSVQLQEFYIKQLHNEFTLSGESAITSDWLNPDFRGDISASIDDLGEFAELFGAPRAAFAGKVSARGRVHTHEHNVDGELALTGDGLKFFHAPVDSLTARIELDSRRVRLAQLELKRAKDFLRINGAIDFSRQRQFQLTTEFSCQRMSDYIPTFTRFGQIYGSLSGTVSAQGNEKNYRTEIRAKAHDLICDRFETLRPLNLTLTGQLSPDTVFFPEFEIANERITAGMMITATRKFLQVQNLNVILDGNEKSCGQFYLPIDGIAFLRGDDFHFDRQAPFSASLELGPVDLAAAGRAIAAGPPPVGSLAVHIEIWNSLSKLNGETKFELRDFTTAEKSFAVASGTVDTRAVSGSVDGNAELNLGHSSSVTARFSLPLNHPDDSWRQQPLFAALSFPAVYLKELPPWWTLSSVDGIVSGQLTLAGTFDVPRAVGDFSLLDGKLKNGSEQLLLSLQMHAVGDSAAIDFLNLTRADVTATFTGELNFADPSNFQAMLTSRDLLRIVAAKSCFNTIEVARGNEGANFSQVQLDRHGIVFSGEGSAPPLTTKFCAGEEVGAPLRINFPRQTDLWSMPLPAP